MLVCSPRLKGNTILQAKRLLPTGTHWGHGENHHADTGGSKFPYVSCLWFLFWVIYKCPYPKTEQQCGWWVLWDRTLFYRLRFLLFYCESIRALWTEYVAYSWPAPLSILCLFKLIHSQLLPAACSPPPTSLDYASDNTRTHRHPGVGRVFHSRSRE